MQNVALAATAAAFTLFLAQSILVAIRTASCVRKPVPLSLAAFLLLAGVQPLAAAGSGTGEVLASGAAWAAGAFVLKSARRRGFGAWVTACIAAVFTLLMARALGHGETLQFGLLRAFIVTGLSAMPLVLAAAMARTQHSVIAWMTVASAGAWLAGGGAATLAPALRPFSSIADLLLSLCTGWMVFQEGYPERSAWGGILPSLKARQPQEPALFTRLLAAESALAAQERAVAAGYLALGAAHEFKSTISMVKLAAHHGLGQADPGTKDRCLRQIVEHTQTARDSAVDVLERIACQGEELPQDLDARRDLGAPLRRAAAALRGEGIVVEVQLDQGVTFRARKSDVEQIVLNLVHNAAESYLRTPSEETRAIMVIGAAQDDLAVIEVRDAAGGVRHDLRQRLFSPSISGAGSTGLGLFLSRNLALANGGNVDYVPVDGGSSFRLTLPLDTGAAPAGASSGA